MVFDGPTLTAAVAEALGEPVRSHRGVAGGAGGESLVVTLASGRRVFVKVTGDDVDLAQCEAAGLTWLAEAEAITLPRVLAVGDAAPGFIVLELLQPAPRASDFDEQLGRGLAQLHRSHPPRFGLTRDNYVGPLPQPNAPASADTFAAFYGERRITPRLAAERDRGTIDVPTMRALEAIVASLADRVPEEKPARLHGDLWSGNLMVGASGQPVLIDPSVWGGHREIDLAMMQLFGGFSPTVFAAYDEAYPLAPGWRRRVPLMQLYPLLVHVALFGRSYSGQLATAVRACR